MHRSTLVAAAVAFCFMSIAAAPASAREARLIYADLNLSSPAGIETFNARVRTAARQACGERFGRISLREYAQIRACKRDFTQRVAMELQAQA